MFCCRIHVYTLAGLFRDELSTTRSRARCESNALACAAPYMTRGHRMYYVARHSCCVACCGIPTHSLHMYGPMSRHHAGAVVPVACTRARCSYCQRCCVCMHTIISRSTAASTVHDTQMCNTHNVAYVCVHHRVCYAVAQLTQHRSTCVVHSIIACCYVGAAHRGCLLGCVHMPPSTGAVLCTRAYRCAGSSMHAYSRLLCIVSLHVRVYACAVPHVRIRAARSNTLLYSCLLRLPLQHAVHC